MGSTFERCGLSRFAAETIQCDAQKPAVSIRISRDALNSGVARAAKGARRCLFSDRCTAAMNLRRSGSGLAGAG